MLLRHIGLQHAVKVKLRRQAALVAHTVTAEPQPLTCRIEPQRRIALVFAHRPQAHEDAHALLLLAFLG